MSASTSTATTESKLAAHSTEQHEQPVAEWGRDPTFWAHAKLFVCQIMQLRQSETVAGGFIGTRGQGVLRVEVCGVVTEIQQWTKCVGYTVDDGTASISCTVWRNLKEGEMSADTAGALAEIGDLVFVQGYLSSFRERQLTATRFKLGTDVNSETTFWLEVLLSGQVQKQRWPDTNSSATTAVSEQVSITDLRTPVQHAADELLKQLRDNTDANGEVTLDELQVAATDLGRSALNQVVAVLVAEGQLFGVEGNPRLFKVVSSSAVINPRVIEAIKEGATESNSGATATDIFPRLKRFPTFANLRWADLGRVLDAMLAGSDIYSDERGRYHIL